MVGDWLRALGAACRKEWPLVVCALAALTVCLAFLLVTRSYAGSLGFPLDDSYIYLTYAKQIGRLEPMSYHPGGPYSAGATSPLWPFLLAPFWMIGLRGYLFVYAAFAVSSVLVISTTVLAFRVAARVTDRYTATVAAAGTCLCGCFAFASLSAMEVGLAATMLLWVVLVLLDSKPGARPSRSLLLLLAITSLTRPELTILVGGFVLLRAVLCAARRDVRTAALWLVPLALPLLWVTTNKLIAGNFFPNTGVAKSHFYAPGFTWAYYFDLLPTLFEKMFKGLFWSDKSPLWSGKLVFLLTLLGLARLAVWARKEKQWWPALLLAGAPFTLFAAVVASSGAWSFHNFRYISAGFSWLAVLAALGVSLPFVWLKLEGRWKWVPRLVPLGVTALIAVLSWNELGQQARYFAQGVRDTNAQVVKIGRFIDRELPADAHVAFHDAGAISYYGDRRGTDILGLVTNHYARHANAGPGTRFENLEHIPPEERPTHFAYYRGWLGTTELFGETLLRTPLQKQLFKGKRRLIGGGNMELMVAKWDAIGSGHQVCTEQPGWVVVDSVDVADRRSEKAHDYRIDLGKRRYGHPTARWSDVRTGSCGRKSKITDGGRAHRGKKSERFTVTLDPSKDARLVIRTGGKDSHWSKTAKDGATVRVKVDGKIAGEFRSARPSSRFVDSVVEIPAALLAAPEVTIELDAVPHAAYRSFHFFVLQPANAF